MRNFDRNSGFKNSSSSHYSRDNRRDDRNDRYYSDDKHRNSSNKGFGRNDYNNKKPRRDYDDPPRHSYQDRTSSGNRSSLHDRSYRGNDHSKNDRSFRNYSPPKRSRDRDSRHSGNYRSNETRHRNMSPPSRPNDYKPSLSSIKSRLAPRNATRIARTGGNKIMRRTDLRSGLVSKRSTTINRAKDYARKIRQARLKLNETTRSSSSTKLKSIIETKSPKKESEDNIQSKNDEEDFIAITNDVDFDEDENESNYDKNSSIKDDSKVKEEKEEDSKQNEKSADKDKKSLEGGHSKDEKDEKIREKQSTSRSRTPSKEKARKFDRIEYSCIHCGKHSTSAQEYRSHLSGRRHLLAMREVGLRVRATLNRLRKVQRDRQLEIEARIKDVEDIQSKYCQVCKLNFRQSKEEHRESDDHKKISSFLKPYCKICRMKLISPMKYEIHRCHTDHIRRKLKAQEGSDDEVNVQELDIGDFKTVDSIGNVDDDDEIIDDDANDQDMSNEFLGKECIEKVEANYCSLCHDFIYNQGDKEDEEKLIKDHCKSRRHINRYQDHKNEERKAKSKLLKEGQKSPEKSIKQNGNDDKTEKNAKSELDSNIDENTNEESKHSENESKFSRYSESND